MSNDNRFTSKNLLLVSSAIALVMFAISAWAWGQLPADARVPTHWNARGQVDGYADKPIGLLLLPGLSILVVVLFAVVPRVDPRRANILRSGRAYNAVRIGTLLFFLAIHVAAVFSALGRSVDMALIVSTAVGLLLILMGNYMGKIRTNFMFGIRTPWTLTSEVAWNKTHRRGGKLFVLCGLLFFLGGIFAPDQVIFVSVGALLAVVVYLFIYSFAVWKQDADANRLT